MKNFYCYECGNIFTEESARTKLAEEGYGLKEMYACPDCGSLEITEADTCGICGEPMIPGSGNYCKDCKLMLGASLQRFVEDVMAIRSAHGEKLSADYKDCEDAAKDYVLEVWG